MGAGLDCIAGAVQQVSNIKCALRSGLTHNVGAQTQSELPQHVHQVGCGLVSQGALCLWVGYLVCPLSQVLVSHVGLPFWLLAFWIAGHALQMLGLVITLGTLQRPFRGQLLSGLAEWEGAPVHKCHADAHTKGFSFFGHFGHLSVLDSNCLHLGQQRPSHEKGNAKLDARPTANLPHPGICLAIDGRLCNVGVASVGCSGFVSWAVFFVLVKRLTRGLLQCRTHGLLDLPMRQA